MDIGYEQWHDGIGYDLEALDQLSDADKLIVELKLIPRADKDWRDIEALDRLGTPRALQAIVRTRKSENVEIRLLAHRYGPPPTDQELEDAILASLSVADIYSGLINVLNAAIEHPLSKVKDLLWAKVRDPESGVAYHCAAALCCMAGVIDSIYDDKHRELFLRLVEKGGDDRTIAVQELERLLRVG